MQNSLPNDMFYLDRRADSTGTGWNSINTPGMPIFSMKHTYMYTHVNGINEFYVESEVNLAQRDWDDQQKKRHYDIFEYTNVDELFDAAIIKEDNFYKYDYSLSASRFITNLTSYGEVQSRDYDPKVAEQCYSYYPKRLIYSLQAQKESKKIFGSIPAK
ncbi:MAG: hypothetical protein CM15mV42_0600 [uncultured marine virus]|nr:MAG: hypothetical protein CM15mV42_0600 [uncultured marine virus]